MDDPKLTNYDIADYGPNIITIILKESPRACDQKDIGIAKPHDENRFNRPQEARQSFTYSRQS
jgi:hypothetical protein